MPEMPASAKAFVTSRPYRMFAGSLMLRWALQGERPTGEGLEVGAGSGAMTVRLLTRYPGLRMVATDYDAELVRSMERSLAAFGDRVTVQRADAAELPFPDERFDFVLSVAMLHHVLAWEKAVAEAVRVLRPGGLLVGYDMLDSPLSRLLHVGRGHDTRMLRWGEMEAELGRLPVADVRVRPGVAALLVRFAARKIAEPLAA